MHDHHGACERCTQRWVEKLLDVLAESAMNFKKKSIAAKGACVSSKIKAGAAALASPPS
jgi:hypothetical protein